MEHLYEVMGATCVFAGERVSRACGVGEIMVYFSIRFEIAEGVSSDGLRRDREGVVGGGV